MAYQKPGIEVSQVIKSNTPILNSPELQMAVVGIATKWLKPSVENEASIISTATYNGSELTIDVSELKNNGESIIPGSVVVDLQRKTDGTIVHLNPDNSDFTVNTAANTITVAANVAVGDYTPIVGFLTTVSGLSNKIFDIESVSDISNILQSTDSLAPSLNPLGFGVLLAMTNAGNAAVKCVNISADTSGEHANAQELLELADVYSIAPLTHEHGLTYKSHVETQSLPENKKERIVFINNRVSDWSAPKNTIAENIQSQSSSISSKRVINVFSDTAYVLEKRHISTLRQSFIKSQWGTSFTRYPLTTVNYTINGITYKTGTEITDSFINNMIASGVITSDGYINALVPVPGYFYCAALAGAVAGKAPQQPLTNTAIVGLNRVYRTNDYFTETQLNTMASGGTWIMVQDTPASVIVTRHQVSTDNTSVTKRELSVTNAVDYAAKMMRNSLKPYIGKFVIDDNFISLVFTVLTGVALFLRRAGILRDVKINSVVQDSINPDTVLAEVELIPLYPANYIKITLII